jgi:L-ribulose-5-phosphate 3-epimerase
MTRIAVMQGRLVPPVEERIQCFPRESWADEFALAAMAHLDCIEWIYDQYGADVNPIATDDGINEILRLSDLHGVGVASLCADYFMDWPLVRVSGPDLEARLSALFWLQERCQRLGIERMVLPFVDASRIDTDEDFDQVVSMITRASEHAEKLGIELHLETSLGPERFADLLSHLQSELVKVNYDAGNSASLGYEPRAEFAAYGQRVGSVHIKDRIKGGSTVPLGSGDANLPAVFECLKQQQYSGDFVMQVARDIPGDEVAWATKNRALILGSIGRSAARIE